MTATFALICVLLAGCTVATPRSAPGSPFSAPSPAGAGLSAGSGTGSGFGVPAHSGAPHVLRQPVRDFTLAGPAGAASLSPPPLAAVTASESIAMPTGSFASPAAVTRGTASWFPARGYQGAVPWWKAGQQPVWATVSRFADGRTYSVTLLVTGFCQCLAGQPGERLIDLSPSAFRQLGASLSVGLIEVTMTVPVQGPRLPATDSKEGE